MTRPMRLPNGTRAFWPNKNLEDHFSYIKDIMNGMISNFKLLDLPGKLCFVPEPGADLIRYNHVRHPVPWDKLIIQQELEERLEDLLISTRRMNDRLSVPTPWTMNITHSRRNGGLIPIYDRFRDGLHPSLVQVKKLAIVIIDFTRDLFNLNGNAEI